ncbi:MAG: holo-ACP synthase [Solirubrobacteraceae bacterium]|jgi:holo-[acyl-carrier protein] synthase
MIGLARTSRAGVVAAGGGLRVGIDLISVAAVEESIRVHAGRYLRRVYTSRELRDCANSAGAPDARRLAARFAAKEAALKVLRAGDEAVPWQSIGVRADRFGRPTLELTGSAEELAARRGLEALDVSLTHEGPFAAAVVVARMRGGR